MPRHRGRRGDGGLTKRPNGKWQAQWSRTEGGKRVVKSETFVLKSEAEWWLREAKRGNVRNLDLTVGEYLEGWLRGKRNIRESTRSLYASHVRTHITPALGHIPITELQPRHVEAFVDSIDLSPGTVGLILRTLKSALEAGVRRREIPDNPASTVEAPKVRRPPVEAMTPQDAADLVAAVRGTWLEQIVRFVLGSGVRIGEACGLDQGDVLKGHVRIRAAKTTPRIVAISADAERALVEAVHKAPRRGKDEPVFFGPKTGDRLSRIAATHALPRVLARAGLRRMTMHTLRHGTATLMLEGGASMRVIADQLGHANPAVTARVYAHVVPAATQRALDILDEAVRRK